MHHRILLCLTGWAALSVGCLVAHAGSDPAWVLHPDSDPLTMNYYLRIEKIKSGMFVTFSEMLVPGPNMIPVSSSKPAKTLTLTINSGWVVNCENGMVHLPAYSEQHFRDGQVVKNYPRHDKDYWYKDTRLAYDICMRAGLKMRFNPVVDIPVH